MKRISLFFAVIFALTLVAPALAQGHTLSGDRLGLFFSGSLEFPANTAFHIRHGFVQEQGYPLGRYDFRLKVDGVSLKETYVDRTVVDDPAGPIFDLLWVFNFPAGMSGVHTFAAEWIIPCQSAFDGGLTSQCVNPNAPYVLRATEVEVTFIP